MEKILILRFSSIGDIVLTTPVIRCLRKQLPKAEIHFLCKTKFATLLQSNPYLDKVYHFEKDIDNILPQLKDEAYTTIVDLHKNLRTLRLKKSLKIQSHSFHKANWAKWLLVNFKINRLPKAHIVHRYMETIKPLGVSYDGQGLDYFLPQKDRFNITNFGLSQKTPFIAFAIGAAHATKRLPKEKIIAICQAIPHKIILLGGPAEATVGKEIAANSVEVINACGKLNLHQSSDAVRQSALVITPDTGMMHIAAAFRKKIVSIWGSTVPDFGMSPFYPDDNQYQNEYHNQIIEVENLSCRPCSKIGFEVCPKGHFHCMQQIDVQQVKAHVLRLLDKG
ncbi:MAG: glycosyltransferase family 9 protein [Saprospiraceae bacterium]